MVVAAVFAGCYDYDKYDIATGEPVTVELAYTFSSAAAGNRTRQPVDAVQTNDLSNPRRPNDLMIIPLINQEPSPSSTTWNDPVAKPNTGRTGSLYYESSYCDLSTGVDRCLVYGNVSYGSTRTQEQKANDGSLILPNFSTIISQEDLLGMSFSLESIYKSEDYNETDNTGKDGIPADALTLASYLNTIASVEGWSTSEDTSLKLLFANFTNHGYDLPGSTASVTKWINALKTALENLNFTDGTNEDNLRDDIISKIDDINITGNYPRNIYLPDGAAVLKWTAVEGGGNAFVPQMQTTTVNNINSVSRFAYPASLYYFTNSSIRTSEEMIDFATEYNNITTTATKTAWGEFLDDKFSGDGRRVTGTTKAVAIEKPVEYAVAQLYLTVKAQPKQGDSYLKDDAGTDITIDPKTFPLTGIIVCGQRPVNYKFEQGSNSDVDVKFIYDSKVVTNGTTESPDYFYLTTNEPSGGPNTLVLQSYVGEDVDIILEFQNNGGQTFKCIGGVVYPTTRFYLVGRVAFTPNETVPDEAREQVFTKDYITTVNMTVSSLAKAYNVLPNILASNLEIGVQTTPKWIAATPTTIKIY